MHGYWNIMACSPLPVRCRMKRSILAVLFVSGCSSVEVGPDIVISYGYVKYDSRSNTFVRRYCRTEPPTREAKLYLSQAQIDRLIAAAKADQPTNLFEMCVTSGPVLEVVIYEGGSAQALTVSHCPTSGSFMGLVREKVYGSTQLRNLPPSDCPRPR